MPHELEALITQRMESLEPLAFELKNESHLHAGHAGSKGGAQHFAVRITSAKFDGINTMARHRLVYACVSDLMPHPIHALRIETQGTV
jgi:BolA protein